MRAEKRGLREGGVSDKIPTMQRELCNLRVFAVAAAVCVLAYTAAAATVAHIDAPPPVNAGGESLAQERMPEAERLARTLKIVLSLDASPSNSAIVVFGEAWDGGLLEPEGAALAIGWDRGQWVIRTDALRERHAAQAAGPSLGGPRSLTLSVRIAPGGEAVGASFDDGGQPVVFGGLETAALLPRLARCHAWEAFSLAARGPGASSARISVTLAADGTFLILR